MNSRFANFRRLVVVVVTGLVLATTPLLAHAASNANDLYRLYNPNNGDHHYTTDANEYRTLPSCGWRQEGVAWYSDDAKGQPLYRLFNPNASVGTHHYTADANEKNVLSSIGWRYEGVAWYGMA